MYCNADASELKIISECINFGIKKFHIEKPLCRSYKKLELIKAMFLRSNSIVTLGTVRRHSGIYKKQGKSQILENLDL